MSSLKGEYVGQGSFISLSDGTVWPSPDSDLSWRLRFATEQITKSELIYAASIIDAYEALIRKTQKRRNEIVEAIKDVEDREAC